MLYFLTAKIIPMSPKTTITGTKIDAKKPFRGSGAGLISTLSLLSVFAVVTSPFGEAEVVDEDVDVDVLTVEIAGAFVVLEDETGVGWVVEG